MNRQNDLLSYHWWRTPPRKCCCVSIRDWLANTYWTYNRTRYEPPSQLLFICAVHFGPLACVWRSAPTVQNDSICIPSDSKAFVRMLNDFRLASADSYPHPRCTFDRRDQKNINIIKINFSYFSKGYESGAVWVCENVGQLLLRIATRSEEHLLEHSQYRCIFPSHSVYNLLIDTLCNLCIVQNAHKVQQKQQQQQTRHTQHTPHIHQRPNNMVYYACLSHHIEISSLQYQ